MVAHNRCTISGTLGAQAQEIWSTSFAFGWGVAGEVISDYESLLTWATDAKVAYIAAVSGTDLADLLSSSAAVTTIRMDYVNAANEVAQSALSNPTPVIGTSAINCPPQSSLVLTLDTGRPGRSYRGRMYWPALGAIVTGSLTLGGGQTPGLIAEDAANVIDAIRLAAPGIGSPELGVFSRTRDEVTAVTGIRVGNVVDTQRRRRNALVETYQSVPFPPVP